MDKIKILESEKEISSVFNLIKELVPELKEENFLNIVREKQKLGYFLAGYFEGDEIISIIGFRFNVYYASGKYLFIDDFATHPDYRSKGIGSKFFKWLEQYALKNDCLEIQVDTNVNLIKAHKFYYRQNMGITHFHLTKAIK